MLEVSGEIIILIQETHIFFIFFFVEAVLFPKPCCNQVWIPASYFQESFERPS